MPSGGTSRPKMGISWSKWLQTRPYTGWYRMPNSVELLADAVLDLA